MNKILTVIVTYNPDIHLLKQSIALLTNQVDKILICDNCSNNLDKLMDVLTVFDKVELRSNPENLGLPINYNKAIDYAIENGYEWLLTMDQDTLVPKNMIDEYAKYFDFERIAIISPVMIDVNIESRTDVICRLPNENYTEIDKCISSASLNKIDVLNRLGRFDEKLFIDQVDFDYCRNVINNGYRIIRVNSCCIEHQIGNSRVINLFGKQLVAFNHSPIRKYYFFRNRVYYARKYHVTIFNEPRYYRNLMKHIFVLMFEKDRVKKYFNAIKGLIAGFSM